MGEKPEQTEVSFKPLKYIGYAIALACSALLVFWNAAEAPDIDIQQMQVTEGLYDCVWQGGGRSGFTGAHLVAIIHHLANFAFIYRSTAHQYHFTGDLGIINLPVHISRLFQ